MKEDYDDGQFKMRLESELEEEPSIALDADGLRLEKISQRVTLISILIPVLIVIVLVIAYMDIKKRMTQTEDTGAMEFQKLSADLESRFSSLSVRQAALEEALTRLIAENNQSLAGMGVKLNKLEEAFIQLHQTTVSTKELNAAKDNLLQEINTLAESVVKAESQFAAMTQDLKNQFTHLGDTLTRRNTQLDKLEEKTAGLDRTKIDKPALDLALRLENLKIEQSVKVQMESLQTSLRDLERKVSRMPVQQAPVPLTAPKPTPVPPTVVPQPVPKAPQGPPAKFEEQNIGK